MILGVGFDIVALDRFQALQERDGFVADILTPAERLALPDPLSPLACALAFAAKEAVLKALGCGLTRGWRWKDIETHTHGIRLAGDVRLFALHRGVATIRSARVCTKRHAFACVIIEGAYQGGAT